MLLIVVYPAAVRVPRRAHLGEEALGFAEFALLGRVIAKDLCEERRASQVTRRSRLGPAVAVEIRCAQFDDGVVNGSCP